MNSAEKLRLLLIRDAIVFTALTASAFVPTDYSMFVILIGVVGAIFIAKKLKGVEAMLDPGQKRGYFLSTCLFMIVWLAVLAWWVFRHTSPQSWFVGGIGLIFILVVLYSAYDQVYGANPKV